MKKWVLCWMAGIIFLYAATTGCKKSSRDADAAPPPQGADITKRYLALGDSYTIGQGVAAAERFPFQLTSLLRSEGFILADPDYIATTGWTSASLLAAISDSRLRTDYRIVTVLIGVNDQYQRLDTASYRTNFKLVLQRAIQLANNRRAGVFVFSIPDYSATPFVSSDDKARVSAEIDWFNAINKQITLQNDIRYIDITPLTREAATDQSLLAPDHLHYSGIEHNKWAYLAAPLVKAVL